jgi:hypothetical protein
MCSPERIPAFWHAFPFRERYGCVSRYSPYVLEMISRWISLVPP